MMLLNMFLVELKVFYLMKCLHTHMFLAQLPISESQNETPYFDGKVKLHLCQIHLDAASYIRYELNLWPLF
jgi:hypothetical protein